MSRPAPLWSAFIQAFVLGQVLSSFLLLVMSSPQVHAREQPPGLAWLSEGRLPVPQDQWGRRCGGVGVSILATTCSPSAVSSIVGVN